MLDKLGLVDHFTEEGAVHVKPRFPAVASVVDLISTSAYILQAFFPKLFRLVQDHSQILTAIRVIIGAYLSIKYAWNWMSSFLKYLLSWVASSVSVSSIRTPYHNLRHFLASKKTYKLGTKKTGETALQMWYKDRDPRLYLGEGLRSENLLLFVENKVEVFFHKGRVFALALRATDTGGTAGDLWTLGTSTDPIQELMNDAYQYADVTDEKDTVFYAARYDGHYSWYFQCRRNVRPVASVDIDAAQKAEIMHDVGEYLSPTTKNWYEERSIPYRRGYLFHGKPGTGKSSLAFAIAGHFGLNIYTVSLLDSELTDSHLGKILNRLPDKALVLLEDIDSAGIDRQAAKGAKPENKTQDKKSSKKSASESKVTLSGLLNAIDGPHAPEGHILVMTTNHPENLDEALTRPGRVDLEVEFKYPGKPQIRDMFMRMYGRKATSANEARDTASSLQTTSMLADAFTEQVPEGEFFPAQLQEFLVPRKQAPKRAVAEIGTWIEKLRDRRKVGQAESAEAARFDQELVIVADSASTDSETTTSVSDGIMERSRSLGI